MRISVHLPSRQTCTDAYLAGTVLVVVGEAVVLVLLIWSLIYLPGQASRLGALALFGAPAAGVCALGAFTCRMHNAEDVAREARTEPGDPLSQP